MHLDVHDLHCVLGRHRRVLLASKLLDRRRDIKPVRRAASCLGGVALRRAVVRRGRSAVS